MGEHRNSGGTRGVSKGPVIAVGTIVVVVLAVIGWFQLRERTADQGVQAADTCVEGDSVVAVAATPDIAPHLTTLAQRFTETRPVVRDHCISVLVTAADSTAVAGGLNADPAAWDETMGPIPALWIPSSSDALTDVPAGTIDGTPRSLAATPIVLATPPAVASTLERANIGWADLPGLQEASDGLDALGLPGWGGIRMQLPTGGESHATTAALTAVAASLSDDPSRLVSVDDIGTGTVLSALSALASTDRAIDVTPPESTDSVLDRLDTDSAADVHAVPVTAQRLDAEDGSELAAYAPTGPTPIADYPAAVLAGRWTDETRRRAAAQFVEFARQPENAEVFVDAGFDEVDSTSTQVVPTASPEARSSMVSVVQDPATARVTTILLDISGSMDTEEGGQTRLSNTTDALVQQFTDVLDSTRLGLWVYSDDLEGDNAFRTVVATGPVDEILPAGTRREQLTASAGDLNPATSTSTYESVTAAYVVALTDYVPGKPNSILLVTDGPDDDTTITPERFLDVLSTMTDPNRPVAIDVVSIGTNPDISTLQTMSDITGGSLTTVATSAGPELPELLRKLLY